MVGCSQDDAPSTPDRFVTAQAKCDPSKAGSTIADEGKTLVLKTKGEADNTGMSIQALACFAVELDMPTSTVTHIDSTSAIDGNQFGSWPGYTARWTYHPDSGVNMTITKA